MERQGFGALSQVASRPRDTDPCRQNLDSKGSVPAVVTATSVPLWTRTPIRALVCVAPRAHGTALVTAKDEPCDERDEREYDDGLVLHIKGRDIYSENGWHC